MCMYCTCTVYVYMYLYVYVSVHVLMNMIVLHTYMIIIIIIYMCILNKYNIWLKPRKTIEKHIKRNNYILSFICLALLIRNL